MNSSAALPAGFKFDPASPEYVDDPYPTYKVLRDHHPAYHLPEHGLWLITRQADVLAALTNPAVWSSSRGNVPVDAAVRVGRTLGTLDPPRHDEQRKIVSPIVAPPNLAKMSSQIRERAGRILDEHDQGAAVGSFLRSATDITSALSMQAAE